MAIGDKRRNKEQADKDWQALQDPPRKYTELELKDFGNKIMKFYEDHTLTDATIVSILNWDKMAVAFGAYTVIDYQGKPYYRINAGSDGTCERFNKLNNLWDQYQDFLRRTDWIANKRAEEYQKLAEEVTPDPLTELFADPAELSPVID